MEYYWPHLDRKSNRDRVSRLALLPCALEVLRDSFFHPTKKQNPSNKNEVLYRFLGKTSKNEIFCVQIKEDMRTGEKFFMSAFPFE